MEILEEIIAFIIECIKCMGITILIVLMSLKEIQDLKKENKRLNKMINFLIDRNDEKQDRINKAIEYIEERFDYVLKDESFLDHDDLAERRIALHLLNILKGDNK